MEKILTKLTKGQSLILDGGTGSELHRRGVNVSKGIRDSGLIGSWSATALIDAPEIVQQVHEDYLSVGSDIITTNSFWTNRPRLGLVNLSDKMEELTRLSAELAIKARNKINKNSFIAGGIAPPGIGDLYKEIKEQSEVLVSAGVDFILLEYIGSIKDCITAVKAVSDLQIPIFVGIGKIDENGKMEFNEEFSELSKQLAEYNVDALLLMCSDPKAISKALPEFVNHFKIPIGAYANIGYERPPEGVKTKDGQWHLIDIGDYTPENYCLHVKEWVEKGVQILGGCCSTTPEHIKEIYKLMKG